MKLFVTENDRIEVVIYAFENEGKINAVHTKEEVPEKIECEELKFTFRKPNYKDSRFIYSKCTEMSVLDNLKLDPVALHNNILEQLLIDWNLTDENKVQVKFDSKKISNLSPIIARTAAMKMLSQCEI